MSFHPRFISVTQAAETIYAQLIPFGAKPGVTIRRRRCIDTMLETELTLSIDRGSSSSGELSIRVRTTADDFHKKIFSGSKRQTKGKYKVATVELEINSPATTRSHTQAQVFSEVLAELALVARVIESVIGNSIILLLEPVGNRYEPWFISPEENGSGL